MIRQPIITVLGHVDHGKTSLLDAIRSTRVVAKEAGAITQHIGATEVPIEVVKKIAGPLIKNFGFSLKIPGLLFIDTPGHEAFTNLRKRGGSIADLAILVIDVTQGIQPQTVEAIEILKAFKVPFVIVITKIDLLNFYSSKEGSFLENFLNHNERAKQLFDEKLYTLVGKIYEYGFESERFDRCVFGKQIPIVPVSAHTKEGLAELLTLLSGLSQKYLEKKLYVSEQEIAKATVLESKEETGLGTTIDIILYQGSLRVNDQIALLGKNNIIQTKIRALLAPKPLQEMRMTKEKFSSVKEVRAARGVKISAPGLENVLVGSSLVAVKTGTEIEELKMELKDYSYFSKNKGLVVKADAIGSLEALMALLRKEGFVIRKAEIGNINRKDVMEACSLSIEEPLLGVVLGFNVNIDADAEEEAIKRGIKLFTENVIYHLIEEYRLWVEQSKKLIKEKELGCLVLPVVIEVLRGKIFRNNKPAIVGVRVLEGKLKPGWKLMNEKGEVIGKVTEIQNEGKSIKEAKKGDEVAISIDGGNLGRNIFESNKLFSCIPIRQYGEIEKYASEFSIEEKKILELIKEKQKKGE